MSEACEKAVSASSLCLLSWCAGLPAGHRTFVWKHDACLDNVDLTVLCLAASPPGSKGKAFICLSRANVRLFLASEASR